MKSRSNSAFFVFFRALTLALILGGTTFFMEVFFLGLLPMLQEQLLRPSMWILPVFVSGFSFLWNLFRNGLFHLFMSTALLVFTGTAYVLNREAVSGLILNTFIDSRIELQRYIQADDPEFENTWLLTKDPFPIYYVDDGNLEQTMSQSTLDSLTAYVAGLPPVLLNSCSAMYLMEEPAFEAMDPEYEDSSVFGLSKSNNFTVNIRLVSDGSDSYTYMHDGTAVSLNDPVFYTETIVHELTHLADMKSAVNGKLSSDREPFASFYLNSPELFGSYGATSSAEWFAEAGVYYFIYPEDLQSMSQDVYSSMDSFFTQLK